MNDTADTAAGTALAGPVVEWICSGVPTELSVPDEETPDLLAEHDLLLYSDDPVESKPRTRCRRLIGHATRDAGVMRLALLLADLVDEGLAHPMMLARRWIEAGYSPDAAAGWVTAGVTWPSVAQTLLSTELAPPDRGGPDRGGPDYGGIVPRPSHPME